MPWLVAFSLRLGPVQANAPLGGPGGAKVSVVLHGPCGQAGADVGCGWMGAPGMAPARRCNPSGAAIGRQSRHPVRLCGSESENLRLRTARTGGGGSEALEVEAVGGVDDLADDAVDAADGPLVEAFLDLVGVQGAVVRGDPGAERAGDHGHVVER